MNYQRPHGELNPGFLFDRQVSLPLDDEGLARSEGLEPPSPSSGDWCSAS
jgi:hypothetical protein